MNNYVYIIRITDSTQVYVGSTGHLQSRIQRHIRELKLGTHHNLNLQRLYKDEDSLYYETIQCPDRGSAYNLEGSIMNRLREEGILLNIGRSPVGGDNLSDNPNREDIISRGVKTRLENNAKMTTEERNLRWGKSGKDNPMYGKKHSEAVKEAGRKRATGVIKSDETIRKIKESFTAKRRKELSAQASARTGKLNSFYGKQHSEHTKRILSESQKGKPNPANYKQMSANGIVYKSMREAAKTLGVSLATITYRTKSKSDRFKSYYLL